MKIPDNNSEVFDNHHPTIIPTGVEAAKIVTIAIACFLSTPPLLKLIPRVNAAAHL